MGIRVSKIGAKISVDGRKLPTIYIGLDTGTSTGVAIYDARGKRLSQVSTMPIHRAMDTVRQFYRYHGDNLMVRFEDARLRKWIPKDAGRERLQGAGSVKRDAAIWEAFLQDYGIRYEAVAPKNNKTKMTAEAFRKLTGWGKACSEHARDAAMLVFGF